MIELSSRRAAPLTPYRTSRPASDKLIFLSCEGCVTEEQYFRLLNELYGEVRTKIRFISVMEDVLRKPARYRTQEEQRMISSNRPLQLAYRLQKFKRDNAEQYQFSEYPDDEFWVVTDVDCNWSTDIINQAENKSYLDEWRDAVHICEENDFRYAVSNPFFEMWLLLHHDDSTDDDRAFAVTEEHPYQRTPHFKERLRELQVPLRKEKHLKKEHYTRQKVEDAVRRAKELHQDPEDMEPHYFATTVYLLVEEILRLVSEENTDGEAED